jgi:hypothetical protein
VELYLYSPNTPSLRGAQLKHRDNFTLKIKSRRMRWVGQVARMREGRGVYRVVVGWPERKRPLERPRRRWEYNVVKMDLRER